MGVQSESAGSRPARKSDRLSLLVVGNRVIWARIVA
jgi:hypothetical protein